LILLISIFLILNKKTLYFKKKCYINIVNKIINYGFEIFNSRDLGMIFKDLRFRDLEIEVEDIDFWFRD